MTLLINNILGNKYHNKILLALILESIFSDLKITFDSFENFFLVKTKNIS